MGVVPLATLLRQPTILFPAIVKETFPATETVTVRVALTPLINGSGAESEMVIGDVELFEMDRVAIAANSFPA